MSIISLKQLEDITNWLQEGKNIDHWLKVNGYFGMLKEEAKKEIESYIDLEEQDDEIIEETESLVEEKSSLF